MVELLMISLLLSSRHIVDDGVSPDMIHCVLLVNRESRLSDDHSYFTLIV